MKVKKRILQRLLLGTGVCLLVCNPISPIEAVVDRIVAVVNQEIITLSEIERWSRSLQEEVRAEDRWERREQTREIFRRLLERVIEERLIEQEAKKLGFKASGKEIDAALEEVKQKNKVDQEELEKALAAEGLTIEAFRKELEKRILRSKFLNSSLKVEKKVGERELVEFFQRNIDQYRIEESYRLAHILLLVPKEATPEEIRRIRKKAQGVLNRIREGADFSKMVMEHSEDASSKGEGGDMGYFKKGELVPTLEKEVRRLRIGEVGELVRTEWGFHIIKLLDKEGGEAPPFEEIRERVKADYYQKEFEKGWQELVEKLKEKSVIEIRL